MKTLNKVGERLGEIGLRLGTRGLYSWSINLDIQDGQTGADVIKSLQEIDTMLKVTFPNHVRRGAGSYQPTNDGESE